MSRSSLFYCLTILLLVTILGCKNEPTQNQAVEDTSELAVDTVIFDEELATRLGADDYGMKPYVMAFLKSGPNRSQDSLETSRLQRAHLDNITKMAEAGQLLVAGPFLDDGEIRGVFIFNATMEEARKLTQTDPAIQAGRLEMELHPWYGPASLVMTKEISEKISRKGI